MIAPDCGEIGLPKPNYQQYPATLFKRLTPGIHTLVTCSANTSLVIEPEPAPATNVDCAHALPLPQTTRRVVEPSRFFSFTLADAASEVAIALTTLQANSGAVGKLRRVSPALEATTELPYLIDSLLRKHPCRHVLP